MDLVKLSSYALFGYPNMERKRAEENYSPEELEIVRQASQLIDAKAYEQYFTLVKNGYQIPKIQKEALSQIFCAEFEETMKNHSTSSFFQGWNKNRKEIEEDEYPYPFNKFLSYGYKLGAKDILTILGNSTFNIFHSGSLIVDKETKYQLEQKFSGKELEVQLEKKLKRPHPDIKRLINAIKNELDNSDSTMDMYTCWKHSLISQLKKKEVFSPEYTSIYPWKAIHEKWVLHGNVNVEELTQLQNELKTLCSNFKKTDEYKYSYSYDNMQTEMGMLINMIQATINQLNKPNFLELLDKTRKIYASHSVEIKKEKIEQYNTHIQELPKETLDKISSIKQTCFNLEKHKDSLNLEQTFALKKIIEESLPTILEQYFNIPVELRDKVIKEDKKAIDYVNSSLDNLSTYLITFNESVAENYLQELAVTEKYTKKLSMY